jgi:molecular chaperone DnaJ
VIKQKSKYDQYGHQAFDGSERICGGGQGGMNMDDIFSQFGDIFGSTLAEVADWWQAEVNRTKGSNLHIKRN